MVCCPSDRGSLRRRGLPDHCVTAATWRIHRRGHGPTWRGAASVVAPGTAIRCAHVPRPGRAIGEPVAQVHGALRTGYRRFEECDVRGHRATVEHLLPDTEHDRVHPEVETVEELLAQEGLHQVQAPDD